MSLVIKCVEQQHPSGPRCVICDEPFVDGNICSGYVETLEDKKFDFAIFILKQGRIETGKIQFTLNNNFNFEIDIFDNECQGLWITPTKYIQYLDIVQNLCIMGTEPENIILDILNYNMLQNFELNLKYKFSNESYKKKYFTIKIYSLIEDNFFPIITKKLPSDNLENEIKFENLQMLSKNISNNCCVHKKEINQKNEVLQSVLNRISKMG